MAIERVQSPKFRKRLVRLIQATGETLSNRAEEIVGHKAGTTAFSIHITFPPNPDDPTGQTIGLPLITVNQSYLSDEAIKAATEMTDISAFRVDSVDG